MITEPMTLEAAGFSGKTSDPVAGFWRQLLAQSSRPVDLRALADKVAHRRSCSFAHGRDGRGHDRRCTAYVKMRVPASDHLALLQRVIEVRRGDCHAQLPGLLHWLENTWEKVAGETTGHTRARNSNRHNDVIDRLSIGNRSSTSYVAAPCAIHAEGGRESLAVARMRAGSAPRCTMSRAGQGHASAGRDVGGNGGQLTALCLSVPLAAAARGSAWLAPGPWRALLDPSSRWRGIISGVVGV